MRNEKVTLTDEQLKNGAKLQTGRKYTATLPTLIVNLQINPEDEAAEDDKYTLYSTDKDKFYKRTLTVNDDKVDGDNFLELHYYPVRKDLEYTLCIDPGEEGEKYNVFENRKI